MFNAFRRLSLKYQRTTMLDSDLDGAPSLEELLPWVKIEDDQEVVCVVVNDAILEKEEEHALVCGSSRPA